MVPVWEFQSDAAVGIDRFCRAQYVSSRGVKQQGASHILPLARHARLRQIARVAECHLRCLWFRRRRVDLNLTGSQSGFAVGTLVAGEVESVNYNMVKLLRGVGKFGRQRLLRAPVAVVADRGVRIGGCAETGRAHTPVHRNPSTLKESLGLCQQ